MADSTLDSQLIVLFDRWPGVARVDQEAPSGSIIAAAHHDVTTAAFKTGEKIALWNDPAVAGQAGMSTFVYLKYEGTAGAPTMAAKQVAVPASATEYFTVSNDPDHAGAVVVEGAALMGVCLSAMTLGNYGWFWCGGICPEAQVSALGGNFATEDNVAAGMIATNDLTADAIGFGPVAADTEASCGFALAADA